MKRSFLPEDFTVTSWADIEPWINSLLERSINSLDDLKQWLRDQSEFEAAISENMAWRYIKMSINTTDTQRVEDYQFFIKEISPKLAPFGDQLNRKLIENPYLSELKGKAYDIFLRKIRKELEMYREKNIDLQSEVASKSQKFGEISGSLNIDLDGEKMTLQKASLELKKTDRAHRKIVYDLVLNARLKVREDLDNLFNELIKLRDKISIQADYDNFRDYMFDALGRFDYTKQDCFDFHESIEELVVPLNNMVFESRKAALG